MTSLTDSGYMAKALTLAQDAADAGEVPIGALIVASNGEIIAAARNAMRAQNDPTGHAEIRAIREACAVRGSERLGDCDLYVTLEPCAMCAAAISFARIRRLYFGAGDAKGGAVEHGPRFFEQATCHHAPDVYGGIDEVRSAALLRGFFESRRG